ncbi:hypothetical protein PMIN01_01503 [Paraphaeosphaeria minitans]|uniref:Uncharacterized protein n=1 Tax=Paraphaeosphaeria minitans TaxID=565426 RepID=A0A9P6GXI3_9PLEO|nr:hypothetical protein PMIN01_01503 [Paraphaeosphaeria minitans]
MQTAYMLRGIETILLLFQPLPIHPSPPKKTAVARQEMHAWQYLPPSHPNNNEIRVVSPLHFTTFS